MVKVKLSDTVGSLKTKLQTPTGMPSSEQRLIHGNVELFENTRTLEEYNVQRESVLRVTLSIKGGGHDQDDDDSNDDDDDDKQEDDKDDRKDDRDTTTTEHYNLTPKKHDTIEEHRKFDMFYESWAKVGV
jgi:ABC-type Zn2+ transport system substrate-binding protein/surface adhesin